MPLNHRKIPSFKRERADELRKLAMVLDDFSSSHGAVVRDTGSLRTAAEQCHYGAGASWRYSMDLLEFLTVPDDTHHRIRPHDSRVESIYLSVDLEGICCDPEEYEDPFTNLEVSIFVQGCKDNRKLSCAWHLDSHPPKKTVGKEQEKAKNNREKKKGEDRENEPAFAHPRYHFQHGGRKMWELTEQEYGSQLLLEAPRIAHPPLDAVLAVDFVLSNYYGPSWLELLNNNPQYQQIVAQAQERCWRAYSVSTASIWERSILDQGRNWRGENVWPQLSLLQRRGRREQ